MKERVIFLIAGLLLSAGCLLQAQQITTTTDTTRVQVYFRQGYGLPDYKYRDNGIRLKSFVENFLADTAYRYDHIRIVSGASPEGNLPNNKRLSDSRANAIYKYIKENCEINDSLLEISSRGVNWKGLKEKVEASDMPYRDEVLDIINNTPESRKLDGILYETRKQALIDLRGGKPWWYMYKNFFPDLRFSGIEIAREFENVVPEEPFVKAPILDLPLASVINPLNVRFAEPHLTLPASEFAPREERAVRTMFALKTNMLYDAATMANVALEVPFNEKFSIVYEHYFPWWLNNGNKKCFEFLDCVGEFRWWFKPKPVPASENRLVRDALVGHYLGVYGMGGKFDVQINEKMCYQGEYFSAGLSYGYSMPIAKRFNLEFSVSAGYARVPHRHYIPSKDWSQLIYDPEKSGTWHYFGPTKVTISLVVPIYINYKKGGNK